jgi:hypothetical protein
MIGPEVRLGSKTVLRPVKWNFCFTPESRHQSGYAADCDVVVCYGGAKLADKHLALNVHCVDEEILDWLERRAAGKKCSAEAAFNSIRKDTLWLQKKAPGKCQGLRPRNRLWLATGAAFPVLQRRTATYVGARNSP